MNLWSTEAIVRWLLALKNYIAFIGKIMFRKVQMGF